MLTPATTKRYVRPLVLFTAITFPLASQPPRVLAQTGDFDPDEQGDKVEDDAWYDVTEWFDGNDYNPTDEAIGRWDDEVWTYYDERTSDDSDNDNLIIDAKTFYGDDYNESNESYVDADGDGNYERSSRYVDSDGDYLNDAYVTYDDADNDGIYDTYDYSELGHKKESAVHPKRVAQSVAEGLSGKRYQVSGVVLERKNVERFGQLALLLQVDPGDTDPIWVDVGSERSALQIFKGDRATFSGPVTKRGNKRVLVATSLSVPGSRTVEVRHEGRRYQGVVQLTKKANVQGEEHLVVKLKTEEGKSLTVDMGKLAKAKTPEKGETITVTGVPASIGDRVILIADQTQQ